MRDDDNPLSDIDLSVWEPPAPPAGLADAVADRMREAVAASPMTHLIQTAPASRRRWLVGGGVAVAVAAAAVVAILVFGGSRPAPSGHGDVVAQRAQHLDLGDVSGDLDPGTELRWTRDRDGLRVEQRRGVAMWKVADDEHFVIDTGAAGASVEASGASLRVEVKMNQSDVRLIGVSGGTAAVVALLTVIVYEGHVRVSSGGQVTTVAPGATFLLEPDKAPKPQPPVVGATAPDQTAQACDEVSCVLNNYADACCAQYKKPAIADDVAIECLAAKDKKDWQALLNCAKRLERVDARKGKELADIAASEQKAAIATEKLKEAVAMGDLKGAKAQLDAIGESSVYHQDAKLKYDQLEKQFSDKVRRQASDLQAAHKCTDLKTLIGQVAKSYGEGVADEIRQISARCTLSVTCDAEALRKKGNELVNKGMYTGALAQFDKALGCDPDNLAIIRLGYLSACQARNAVRARQLFAEIPAAQQGNLAEICRRNHIDVAASSGATCGASDLRDRGVQAETNGKLGEAIDAYEQSLQCRRDDEVLQRAYFASCKASNAAKARQFFGELSDSDQVILASYCSVSLAPRNPSANGCVADTLRALGTEYVNMGQYGAALVDFKKAMTCKGGNTLAVIRLAYMAACQAGDATSAKQYFDQIPPAQQGNLAQICLRNKIDVTKSVPAPAPAATVPAGADCDPDALRSKGTEYVNMGQYAAGLQQFLKGMKCKGGATLAMIRLAYMAACQAGEAATATELFNRIPVAQQGNLAQICNRNKIDVTKP